MTETVGMEKKYGPSCLRAGAQTQPVTELNAAGVIMKDGNLGSVGAGTVFN